MSDVDEENEPRCGFDVCIPTPGVPPAERCCGKAEALGPLCMPNFFGPFAGLFKKEVKPAPFYSKDSKPAFIVVMLMGLQHMLAMLVGVITPPRLLANEGCLLGRDTDLCALTPYLICSALLASGIFSIFQIMRFKLCGGFYFGTGLISVMGPSFTFLPIGQMMMQEATLDFSGTNGTGLEWYGNFLGTCAVAALVEVVISFVPPKYGCVPTHLTSHDLRLTHYLLPPAAFRFAGLSRRSARPSSRASSSSASARPSPRQASSTGVAASFAPRT